MASINSAAFRDLWRSKPWTEPERCLFWLAFTILLHDVLVRLAVLAMVAVDRLLTAHQCWSTLLCFPFVCDAVIGLFPALLTGLIIARFERAYRPSLIVPLGVACYWFAVWGLCGTTNVLPGFLAYAGLAAPAVLLWAWVARWASRLAARESYLDPQETAIAEPRAAIAHLGVGWDWAWVAFFVAILLVRAWHIMPFLADDALISLRYAQRLIEGKGLTWTDGYPVEGYSNLLWVLANACLGWLGADLIVAARVLGCVLMITVIIAIGIAYSSRAGIDRMGMASGLLFFSCATPIVAWAIGGLEQPLLVALLAGSLLAYNAAVRQQYRNWPTTILLGVLLGLLCLTRPDGPLFTVALAAAFCLGCAFKLQPWSWTYPLVFVTIPALCCLGQLAFRLWYYHEWVPNTALVKIAFTWSRVIEGWDYVSAGLSLLAPFSYVAGLGLVLGLAHRQYRIHFLPLLTTLVIWLGYVVIIGGDAFLAHRHLTPAIVVLAMVLVEGTPLVYALLRRQCNTPARAALVGTLFLSTCYIYMQLTDRDNPKKWEAHWVMDGLLLGDDLKQAFSQQQPTLAVTAAGCLPYQTGFPSLDMLGLNDYYLTHSRTYEIGQGMIGHELGDADYVLGWKPDLIIWNLGTKPMFRGSSQIAASKIFQRSYAEVRVRTRSYDGSKAIAQIWFRRDSEKIGIRHEPGRMVIPAFFFNADESTEAFPHGNRLSIAVDAAHPAAIDLAGLKINDWAAEIHGEDPRAVQCQVEPSQKGLQIRLTTQAADPVIVDEVILRPAGPQRMPTADVR